MATKPRQPRPPRAIPTWHATGAEHEAAVAATGARYAADLDGEPPHWVIRDRETGEIAEHCPNAQASEVEERAALLNRGEPTRADNIRWGTYTTKRMRPGNGVKDGAIALRGGLTMPSATECVERLVRNVIPKIPRDLELYKATEKSLDRATLTGWLADVIEPRVWAAFMEHPRFEQFINSVSEQLRYTYGIRRANDRQ